MSTLGSSSAFALRRRGPRPAPRIASVRRTPHRPASLPAVDERLVMPETRYEAIDGKIAYVCPSDEPHGTYHSKLAALLEAHVTAEYQAAVDMLTRTSAKNDLAPDASVFPAARDPETGGRRLEELAFEVVSTESLGHAARKARALSARGVRRVFAVDVERRRVLAWSERNDAWEALAEGGAITDATLAAPLPHAALAEAMRSDDAVARALLAKKNPVLEGALQAARASGQRAGKREGKRAGMLEGKRAGKREGMLEGKREGMLEGKIAALLQILAARGLRVTKKADRRLRDERDEAVLDRWLGRAASCPSVGALLGK
jgi:Uma2 family endonuclease